MNQNIAFLQNERTPAITSVQFGLLNPEKVIKRSVVEVNKTTLYVRQLPASNGLNDLRMGTSDRRLPCGTCKNDILNCPGHEGHMILGAPVYHPSMMSLILKILRCTCFFCSKLLIASTDSRMNSERIKSCNVQGRLDIITGFCKTIHFCAHCQGPQPKYNQVRGQLQIKTEFRAKDNEVFQNDDERAFANKPFTAAHARSILQYISDEDVTMLGLNAKYSRPEWLILTVLQIPPPISRPAIMATDGSRSRGQDDVSIKLQEILKINQQLKHLLDAQSVNANNYIVDYNAAITTAVENLQNHTAQFFHHDSRGTPGANVSATGGAPRSNRPLRLIPSRLKTKRGRFRGTLGGKRVDFSARTVVSPAPTYDIDEVGIPEMIAKHLTFPERVNNLNINELTERVRNGPGVLYGAVVIIMPDGNTIDLSLCSDRSNIELQPGWVVERYMKDGDWGIFNRQPSLHRMSIMAHRVRIHSDKTFRLPLSDTTPYNADFDGDEMNFHLLRSYDAIAEAIDLMRVSAQIISPQSNKPIIGLVQDSLVSGFLMTQCDTFLTRDQVMQIMMVIKYPLFTEMPPPCILKPVPLWSGKQVFSMLLPPLCIDAIVRTGGDDLKGTAGLFDLQERRVVIKNGEIVCGSLCKKMLGTSAAGIIHVLVKDFGNDIAGNFIGDAQRVLVEYMLFRGFSVGISDCVLSSTSQAKVHDIISKCFAYGDKIRQDASDSTESIMETCLSKLMNGMLTRVGAIVQNELSPGNRIQTMVTSGAKGSSINITQILGCVGQQSVEGGRIKPGKEKRTLSHYSHNTECAESRGFVSNSYGTGLIVTDYFFHAMGGREGLVDTAVKTALTGYIQRRLVKAQESLQIRYDTTVRNTQNEIVQFYYGGDNFNPMFVEKKYLCTCNMSNADLWSKFDIPVDVLQASMSDTVVSEMWQVAIKEEIKQLLEDRDWLRYTKLAVKNDVDSIIYITLSPERLLDQAVYRFHLNKQSKSDMCDPNEVISTLNELYEFILNSHKKTATHITLMYLRVELCFKKIIVEYRLSKAALQWVVSELRQSFNNSLAHAGDMVGVLAASSVGEPCTQMTLNTFHLSGVAEQTVTLGVPRLKELIDATRNIRTPSLSVYLEKSYAQSEKMAKRFGTSLEYTVLHQILCQSAIHLDPVVTSTCIESDVELVQLHYMLHPTSTPLKYSKFIIRYELDRELTCEKYLTPALISNTLKRYLGNRAQIIRSETNMLKWVIRIRIYDIDGLLKSLDLPTGDSTLNENYEREAMKSVHNFLNDNISVNGIKGILNVIIHKAKKTKVIQDTGCLQYDTEWIASTQGTDLKTMLTLPAVDKTRTICNDIHEVISVLGIEAARDILLCEIRTVLSFDGSYVNERHLQLLADVMTHPGTITSITRHSMDDLGGSSYQQASFEETQVVLSMAAAFGVKDKVNGVTDCIITGQPIHGGTGSFGIIEEPIPVPTATMIVRPMQIKENDAYVAPMYVAPTVHVKPMKDDKFVGQKRKESGSLPKPATFLKDRVMERKPSEARKVKQFAPMSPAPIDVDMNDAFFYPRSPVEEDV